MQQSGEAVAKKEPGDEAGLLKKSMMVGAFELKTRVNSLFMMKNW